MTIAMTSRYYWRIMGCSATIVGGHGDGKGEK